MPAGKPFATTQDRFLGGRLEISQPADGYRAGSDPVFLAASVPAKAGEQVLDLGCGVGTASLCLAARVEGVHVTGLELQPELAELARANAEGNRLSVTVAEGCLTAAPLAPGAFDWVMTNPPWYESASVSAPTTRTKALGHVEGDADLATWVRAAQKFLKPKGRMVVIHRADRLGDILGAMAACRLGAVRVLPLFPRPGRPAIRVLVSARKGSRAALELLPGLVLHGPDGFTAEAEAVLRHGEALAGMTG